MLIIAFNFRYERDGRKKKKKNLICEIKDTNIESLFPSSYATGSLLFVMFNIVVLTERYNFLFR